MWSVSYILEIQGCTYMLRLAGEVQLARESNYPLLLLTFETIDCLMGVIQVSFNLLIGPLIHWLSHLGGDVGWDGGFGLGLRFRAVIVRIIEIGLLLVNLGNSNSHFFSKWLVDFGWIVRYRLFLIRSGVGEVAGRNGGF